jgi:hypothetical protein
MEKRIAWEIKIEGLEDLTQSEKEFALSFIARCFENLNEFDGVFTINEEGE